MDALSDSLEELKLQLKEQGTKIKELKANGSDESMVKGAMDHLAALKAKVESIGGTSSRKSKAPAFTLKTPKGTKDWNEKDMALREKIFGTITRVFKRHGGVTIDTPVFELKEILSGKYGEDSKLIYDLQDQGGELCSLRYDLTVPFARFLAMNGSTYSSIKRYHIAKVYRRDQPVMTKGRMREFYQCDFDIAGSFDPMIPDSEILRILCEILEDLDIGIFTIKLNHRKILDGIFAVCGVPAEKIRTISSAVDKLDKMAWIDVRKEMTDEKGLDGAVADKIGEYVKLKGSDDLLQKLLKDATLTANKTALEGLKDMEILLKYLTIFEIKDKVSFDLSLARGLDYYTGIIYEAVVEQSAPPKSVQENGKAAKSQKKAAAGAEDEVDESQVGVGSIAAGGRYDNLVGMFASNAKANIPCVGISIGVERVFSIMSQNLSAGDIKSNESQVYVMALGDGLLEERMRIASELWKAGLKAEFMYKAKPKPRNQWDYSEKEKIPFAVIIGQSEVDQGVVRIKQLGLKDEEGSNQGDIVQRVEMITELRKRLASL